MLASLKRLLEWVPDGRFLAEERTALWMTEERRTHLMEHGATPQTASTKPPQKKTGWVVIPDVIDSKTMGLCQRFIALLCAEGWDGSACKYMSGPKGTRTMITKEG